MNNWIIRHIQAVKDAPWMSRRYILFEVFKKNLTVFSRVVFRFRGNQRTLRKATQHWQADKGRISTETVYREKPKCRIKPWTLEQWQATCCSWSKAGGNNGMCCSCWLVIFFFFKETTDICNHFCLLQITLLFYGHGLWVPVILQ